MHGQTTLKGPTYQKIRRRHWTHGITFNDTAMV